MIDLYTFTTPNGRKPAIMLEETQLPYQSIKIDISKGDQFTPEFIAINPNSKIPAIVDQDTGITVFESGAILIYLAEKTGQLLPTDTAGKMQVIEWLMFQMASVGPMFGQLNHFRRFAAEKIPYAIERYEKETLRLYGVMDGQLANHEFLAGDYSIADIATYPWVAAYEFMGLTLDNHPNLKRWVRYPREQRPSSSKKAWLFWSKAAAQ
ncbi:MAG: glutathione S-transferase family protein, partial [Oscillatoriales cyanobacterium RM1_1_9]|nr:glutathione S-transferase family protein [Oscillatoriales cyanobacterium RM1_1_9]